MRVATLTIACCFAFTSHAQFSVFIENPAGYFWDDQPIKFNHFEKRGFPVRNGSIQYLHNTNGLCVSVHYLVALYDQQPVVPYLDLRHYDQYSLEYLRVLHRSPVVTVTLSAGPTWRGYVSEYYVVFQPHPSDRLLTEDVDRKKRGCSFGAAADVRLWRGITARAGLRQSIFFRTDILKYPLEFRPGLGYTFGGGINRRPARKSVP